MEVMYMFNKKDMMIKLGTMIMVFAFIIPLGGSVAWIGEPELPKKFQQ